MTFTPTPEQIAICDFISGSTSNLIIDALAGAAKTSTLALASQQITTPAVAIAFNKLTAMELGERLPSTCDCRTIHSLGLRSLRTYFRSVRTNAGKRAGVMKDLIQDLSERDAKSAWDGYADMMKCVSANSAAGYIPADFGRGAAPLTDELSTNEINFTELELSLIHRTYTRSLELAFDGILDFDDMVLLPAVFPVHLETYPVTMIDEAQDLSLLNHRLLTKLTRNKRNRLIAVGDPYQAIYGFRGADHTSMAKLSTEFTCETLRLSTSFRCARSIANHVRSHVPHITSPDWAIPGTVSTLETWTVNDIPPEGTAILCRNNAPLFRMALRLIRAGRRPQILGNDITTTLVKDLNKLGSKNMSSPTALKELEKYANKLRARSKAKASIEDRITCLTFFLTETETLGAAIAMAETITKQTGPIQLMTIHKSKGKEFPHVFLLDAFLIGQREEELSQEQNLWYVGCTRAKETLTYVNSEDWG